MVSVEECVLLCLQQKRKETEIDEERRKEVMAIRTELDMLIYDFNKLVSCVHFERNFIQSEGVSFFLLSHAIVPPGCNAQTAVHSCCIVIFR